MKKTVIILSALMVMSFSNGVIYAEAGEGKPLEIGKKEINIQNKSDNEGKYNFISKVDNEKNTPKETEWEIVHKFAHERSEER